MSSKQCTGCGEIKELELFHRKAGTKDGRVSHCKECKRKYIETYLKTEDGILSTIYKNQRSSSKSRKMALPSYSKLDLKVWLYENGFKELYNNWVKNNYDTMLKPSVDRKNDYLGYGFDNIQLVTWGENKAKGNRDRKEGRNNKASKAVLQYTKDGIFIKEYYSIREAERQTEVNRSDISGCCKGKRKTAGKFIWKYKEIEE